MSHKREEKRQRLGTTEAYRTALAGFSPASDNAVLDRYADNFQQLLQIKLSTKQASTTSSDRAATKSSNKKTGAAKSKNSSGTSVSGSSKDASATVTPPKDPPPQQKKQQKKQQKAKPQEIETIAEQILKRLDLMDQNIDYLRDQQSRSRSRSRSGSSPPPYAYGYNSNDAYWHRKNEYGPGTEYTEMSRGNSLGAYDSHSNARSDDSWRATNQYGYRNPRQPYQQQHRDGVGGERGRSRYYNNKK